MDSKAQLLNHAREFVTKSIASFDNDAPDSDFQRGYLAALEVVAKEGLKMSLAHKVPFKSTTKP